MMEIDSNQSTTSSHTALSTSTPGHTSVRLNSSDVLEDYLLSPSTAGNLLHFAESTTSPRGTHIPAYQLSSSPPSIPAPRAMELLCVNATKAVRGPQTPARLKNGTGGAYILRNEKREPIGVFKPADEEPFCENNPNGYTSSGAVDRAKKRGVPAGESSCREVAAFLLDHGGFANVPPTAAITLSHPAFAYRSHDALHPKSGSFQQWVPHVAESWDFGPSRFSTQEIHAIGVLDIRVLNCDRHGGNLLVTEDGHLVPIDHGYILPSTLDEAWFEWLIWPQAKRPFSAATVQYVLSLSVEDDVQLLRGCVWNGRPISAACVRVFRCVNVLLQLGVRSGLTLYDIGLLVCRMDPHIPCALERIACEAVSRAAGGSCPAQTGPFETGSVLQDEQFAAVKSEERFQKEFVELAAAVVERTARCKASN